MKIEIEKVQKIKSFEPFIVKIQFDTVDDARDFLDRRLIVDDKVDDISKDVRHLFETIKIELKQQGYIHYHVKSS
jgi:hypothetical protein